MDNIIYGLSNEDYHHSPPYNEYLSSSQLKWYNRSPKFAKFMLDNPQEETDAMRFGSLFHDLMACMAGANGMWAQGYGVWLDGLARFDAPVNPKTGQPYGATTKAYAEAYAKFKEDNADKLIASRDELNLAYEMCHSLWYKCGSTSEQVRKLLKWGKPEVSIFYETEDGIKIKIRPDLLTPKKIVDWKSTTLDDLTEESINRTILHYGYHISAAMYQYVYHAVTGKWLDFYLVFVQKQEPYDCVMVDMANYGYRYLPDVDMVIPGPGAIEFDKLLTLHTKCVKSGEYPGAETFIPGDKYRIMEIEPPRYYANKYVEEY